MRLVFLINMILIFILLYSLKKMKLNPKAKNIYIIIFIGLMLINGFVLHNYVQVKSVYNYSTYLNGNSENNLSNKNNEHEIDNSKLEEDVIIEYIDPESNLPYGEDGIEIKSREELSFETRYTRNYFKVAFKNTGNNDVTVNIQSARDSRQDYDLEIPAGEDNDVYFGNLPPDRYFLDITGYRGGQCKGIVNVEISNTPFE
ncbi:hypothetical protein ACTNDY_06465 [Tissierellaceae bacterium HCP3S3_D8]